MQCPSCGEATLAHHRFCPSCGQHLEATCAACASSLPEGARFCPACGASVGAAGERQSATPQVDSEPAVERRRVTVLFVDLVGFTELARGLDPEEVRDLQALYFERARELVERYGGRIEKYIGDAVMAAWGAPTANEDDAERAARAGLDLVAAVGTLADAAALTARAGVATGEVAVTVAGGEWLLSGETVNLAARLQAVAPAGGVLTDQATRDAARAAIAFDDAGEQELKGFPERVPAWRALRAVAGRGGAGRAEELEAPFVGRVSELTLLKDLFHATASERRLRVVSVTGQAGIGKSRLAWEFEKYLDAIDGDVYWHQGRSPAYGEGITFWALGEMVRRRANVSEGDDDATTARKLREMLDEHVPDEKERARLEPALAALLAVGRHEHPERGELFGAWRTLFERLAAELPVVMVFEDLQWADGGLVDFIAHLLEWSRQQPIFIVTLARPELVERFPSWGAGQRNFTSIHLEPLADGHMRDLLAGLAPGLPAATIRAILRRAEGVPLYAVEIVRMLVTDAILVRDGDTYRVDRPVAHVSLPPSLQALVAARLDALAPAERSLIQHAAVLGTSFSVDALAAVTGQDDAALRPLLERLAARELIRVETDPQSPERGQYLFVQGVIREVAYGTLARRDRKDRHLAAARWFESQADDELAGALARHYVDAWRAASSGPEAEALAAQARVALRAAADRAISLHSYGQALAFLELALDVVADPAERAVMLERAATAAWHAARHRDSERLLLAALEVHRTAGDAAGAARVTLQLGVQLDSSGRIADAIETLSAGRASLLDAGLASEDILLRFDAELARAYFLQAEHDRALELADQAIEMAERLDVRDVLVDALITKGSALSYRRPREGDAALYGAIALADRYGLTRSGFRARHNLSVSVDQDDPAAGAVLGEESLAIARRLGLRDEMLWSMSIRAHRLFLAGSTEEARAAVEEVLADETIPDLIRYFHLGTGALLDALEGHDARAVARLDEMEDIAGRFDNPDYLGALAFSRAIGYQLRGDFARSAETLEAWWRSAAYIDSLGRSVIGSAFARVGRVNEARAMLQSSREAAERGRVVDASRRQLEAGLAALEHRPGASALFVESEALSREVGHVVPLALTQLDHLMFLGPADEPARQAGLELRELCAARAWNGLRALVDPLLLPSGVPPAAEPAREGQVLPAAEPR